MKDGMKPIPEPNEMYVKNNNNNNNNNQIEEIPNRTVHCCILFDVSPSLHNPPHPHTPKKAQTLKRCYELLLFVVNCHGKAASVSILFATMGQLI